MKSFDITDIESWVKASDVKQFTWKDSAFFNEDTGKNITEKEIISFIGKLISVFRQTSSDEKIALAGLSNIIILILDLLDAGLDTNNIFSLIHFGIENQIDLSWNIFENKQEKNTHSKIFDIKEMDSWKFATGNTFIWEGKPFNLKADKIFSEILFVKILILLLQPVLDLWTTRPEIVDSTISLLLAGLKENKNIGDILEQLTSQINKINENDTQKTKVKNSISNDTKNLDECINKLNTLVGLKKLKIEVNSLINTIKNRKMREEQGLKQAPMSLHLVFQGNPGTGKTTVARILADIYKELGVIKKGHLVEVDRSGLVAGYMGQTAINVQKVVNNAIDGILFIDEAYSLTVKRHETDFGFEAVDTLLKAMEDNRDKLIVIVAGYPDKMEEFLNSNPGLKSRFNNFIHFEDYNSKELYEIFIKLCNEFDYKLSSEASIFVQEYLNKIYTQRDSNFANGRDVRNYFEKVQKNQSNRLSLAKNVKRDELIMFELADCIID